MMRGSDTAAERSMRFAPCAEAHPGVNGSPGAMKSKPTPPRWMRSSGPHGPRGNVAPLLREEYLGAAVAVRDGVADEQDFSAQVDPACGQRVEISFVAVTRVDEGSDHVTACTIGVKSDRRRVASFAARVRFTDVCILLAQHRAPGVLADRFDECLTRVRQQNIVLDDFDRVETRGAPLIARPFGEAPVTRRSRHVRFGGEKPMVGVDTAR
jgi:hypothetical protein